MSSDANKEALRRFFDELWNQGNMAIVDELCSPHAIQFDPTVPQGLNNEGFKEFVTGYRTAFPNMRMSVMNIIGEDDFVAVVWNVNGNNSGELMGMSPSGKQVSVNGISVYELSDGKIVQSTTNWDQFGMFQQLGIIPQSREAEVGQ